MKKNLTVICVFLFAYGTLFAGPGTEEKAFKKLSNSMQQELLQEYKKVKKECNGTCVYMIDASKNLIQKKQAATQKIEKEELAPLQKELQQLNEEPYAADNFEKIQKLTTKETNTQLKISTLKKDIKNLEAFLEAIDSGAWVQRASEKKEIALLLQEKIDSRFTNDLTSFISAMFQKA